MIPLFLEKNGQSLSPARLRESDSVEVPVVGLNPLKQSIYGNQKLFADPAIGMILFR